MGRPRSPERGKSLKRYIESGGKISTAELAELANVTERRIRQWKLADKWDEALEKKQRKKGGQKGNKNAAGKTPAKKGNKNAATHGAFARAGFEDIPPERADEIKGMGSVEVMPRMLEELQALYLRKAYLEKLLDEYESPDAESFYTDRMVHMIVPNGAKGKQSKTEAGEAKDPEAAAGQRGERFKTAMKTIVKSSPFDRAMKVGGELDKLHGRIIKQLDSIKAYEMESRRMEMEERRLDLMRQRMTGEIDIEPDIGAGVPAQGGG